ncbi:hypothetical protein [Klebsiella phage phiKp_21]|uniref:Macro domain-containing protein n=1 Tax=Klebsiella phage vB_KleM_RaK2 TaxID=1147094 RepID=H6X3J2_9CAUD|nr:hypothetical protein F403_gp500 [Klebsiella phage vB_KleM_RaK2]YP_010842925.1 macro domain-containing protein [Klebsiella phage K64-1]QOE32445.1 ADP ribose binding protein [Klebsiella phage Muenster]UYL05469.1 hypothetical protein DIDNDMLP_00484 [Klebsiella phage KP13-7]BEH88010.1 hypothetical protein [Klebsiella phage phiKp_21]AFA44308.1 hypothetical protein RaK2_00035 [Klebsiella phage vB_KleM_RaK2]
MIQIHNGNLFEKYITLNTPPDALHIIVHGCNAQGKMGSGFAKELRTRFPVAYTEYSEHISMIGTDNVLGTVSYVAIDEKLIIANAITQQYYGYDSKKYVSYDAVDTAFKNLNAFCDCDKIIHVHFPKIGADLGGGNWNVIKEIIDGSLINAHKHLYILN